MALLHAFAGFVHGEEISMLEGILPHENCFHLAARIECGIGPGTGFLRRIGLSAPIGNSSAKRRDRECDSNDSFGRVHRKQLFPPLSVAFPTWIGIAEDKTSTNDRRRTVTANLVIGIVRAAI
jgi:hypothetical protein